MSKVDLSSAFKDLQDFYACAKCGNKNITTPVLLKSCRHIFCTRCVIISGQQQCPKCGMVYRPADVDRGNGFLATIFAKIKRIEALFPNGDYTIDVPTNEESEVVVEPVVVEPEARHGDKAVRLCKAAPKRNQKGETQLHLACKKGLVALVQKLIGPPDGMDVNCVDWGNWTPLHEAVQKGSMECVRMLLDAGCLPSVPAQNYATPLHQAVDLGRWDIVKLLVEYGADLDAIDINGRTPRVACDAEIIAGMVQRTFVEHALVFDCNSFKSGPKTKLLKGEFGVTTVTNGMEHLAVPESQRNGGNLFNPQVLAALLQAVPVIYEKDVPAFGQFTSLAFVDELIPEAMRAAYGRSLNNRCRRLPKLFDGMHIHLPPNVATYKMDDDVIFTRDDLHTLIVVGGGTVLKRAPTESTVAGITTRPFHCRHVPALVHCSHYIVYDDFAAPELLYNMNDLRHVSARWLTKCMWEFQMQ